MDSHTILSVIETYLADCFQQETVPHAGELAQWLGLQSWELTRTFSLVVGMAPSAYLKRAQVLRAAALLATTSLSTTVIAYQSGFTSRRTMFRAFRRLIGVTPREAVHGCKKCL
jgi:AraC-like DNA-binding protein